MTWDGVERRKVNLDRDIAKLRDLTLMLPSLAPTGEGNGYKTYNLGGGTAFSWTLHRGGNRLLVQRWFFSAGCFMAAHQHKGIEVIFVYEGEIEMDMNGGKRCFKPGETCVVPAETIHIPRILSDFKAIVITSPVEENYI